MDYDDNDFQSQNLHLAGEGSTKYPPVLRPYALPKFDFDDSLQGHLRFDSLVETEVFLGIESNEDNRWIDDFSRGSSGIEFSSSAAESCSISRRNNVWSEATSSESVEMLLKSVGQEEIIPAQTIIEESDACDLPGCLMSEMEPSLKHDDNILSKTKGVTDVQSTLPPDEIRGNFSVLKGDVGEDQSLVKVDSQTQEDKLFVDGSSNDMDPNAVSGKRGLHETDKSVFPDIRCDNAHKREVDTSIVNNMDVKRQQDSFASGASGMMVDNLLTSVQNIVTSRSEWNNNDAQRRINVSDENLGGHVLSTETQMDDQKMDENMVDNATCNHEKLLCSESKVETVAEASAVEDRKIRDNPPPSNILTGHSYQHMVEGCSEGECSGVPVETSKCEDMLLCKDIDVSGDQPEVNIHELSAVSVAGGAQFEGHAVEASHTSAEIPSNVEPEMDSIMTIRYGESRQKEDMLPSDQQLDIGRSEASLSSIDVDKDSKDEGHEGGHSHVGGISNLSITCSLAEVGNETLVTGASEGVNNTLEVSTKNLTTEDHVSPPTEIDSLQICEENKACEDADINRCNSDAFVSEKENAKLPNESRDMDGDVGESLGTGVGSSSFDEGSKEDKLIVSEFQHATADGSGSVSDVNVGNSIFASSDTSDPVALSSGNVVKMDVDHEEVCVSPQSVAQLADLDKKGEAAFNISKEASISSPMGSSQVETGPVPVPVSEAKEGVSCDIAGAGELQSLPTRNDFSIEPGTRPQASAVNEVGKESTKEADVYPVLCESIQKEVDVAEAPESHNGTTKNKKLMKESADSAEPATINDEMLTQPGSLPLEEMCSGKPQNVQEGCEATQISEDNNSGQASEPNAISSLCSDPLPESHAKLVSQDNGGSSTDHYKPSCGSSKLSPSVYGKGVVKESTNQNVPVSEVVDRDVGNASSNSHDTKGNDASKDGISGSFDVSSLAELSKGDAGKNWPSIPPIAAPKIAEEPPSNSGSGQMDAKITQDISQAGMPVSGGEIVRGRSKGTPERKTRRSSTKATGKDSSKKGSHVKETTPVRQSEKGDKVSNVSVSPSGIFQLMQPNEMPHYGHVEGSNTKPYFLLGTSTSSLPDLNSSASPSAVFQQPFTDMQQVQLRAQIFVYGALIQGTAPEEAYMASAFGGPDFGRSTWENAWHACIARVNGQTSNLNQETPLYSRSGPRVPEQVVKQSAVQSKGISPAGRASSKGTQPNINPMIPLSSPLWSISTPAGDTLQSTVMPRGSVLDYQQSLTPLHPFQTPPMRNLVGHNTSWMSQGPFRGTWVASPQPSLPEASTRFSTVPITEAVQLTPPQETSIPHSSSTKHASVPLVHSGGPTSVFTGPSPLLDPKKVVSSAGQHPTDPKSRKRKKNPVSQELGHINLQSQSQSQPVLASVDPSSLSTSVTIATPKTLVAKPTDNIIMSVSATSSEHLKRVDQNVVQRASLSEETLGKIKEAKKHAEDATALAVTAISHSQDIWNQLDKQNNSGLTSDVEAKLASAAVAVAAAAAVAKAAAAAANVASNAALQAKLMADEALILSSTGSSSQYSRISSSDGENVLGKATPASILRGEDGANSSSSVIFAAREAAKRKVEAASAASKRAENMDAIVKAAELAAEAVSQAGKIVAMGDPLPLSELVQAGPEGYWKIPQASFERIGKSTEMIREQSNSVTVGEFANAFTKHSKEELSGKKETQTSANGKSLVSKEATKELTDHNMTRVDGISGSVASSKKESRGQKGRKVSDLAPNISVVLEPEIGSKSPAGAVENEFEKAAETSEANDINEGSQVEVFKDGNGYKAAWFTAKVLSVEDGKAFVCYTELQSDEGLGQLKEWVALKGDGNKAPKIRNARPLTAMRYEGTRKRRRAAIGDYTWSVGDKVDAWITDSWWEGVVTEKNKKDETTLTVHFPAQCETSVVKAWHLRPSLIWKDGEWVEFSNLQNDSSSHEGDMPKEKRLKLGSPAVEAKGKDKISKSTDVVSSGKLEESRLLDLSANDKVFNIGKNTRNENKLDTSRAVRTGLRKEGSRVVIGVPKPGKKRKFMEVSKHYVADQSNKINEVNDSAKLVKYLMPQGSGSRGLKSTKTDAKDKRVAEAKLKGLKSGKPQSVSSRTVPQKNSLSTAVSAHNDPTVTDNTLSHVENPSGKHNQMESGSFSSMDETPHGPVVFSSLDPSSDAPSKKISTSTTKPERANKGKLAPAGGKLGKIEEDRVFHGDNVRSTSEVVEPRRSIRRIQPTSRLLEGLQSSLIISKIPSVSHDKGHRSQKNIPRGNNHG